MASLHDAIKKHGYEGHELEVYLVRLLFLYRPQLRIPMSEADALLAAIRCFGEPVEPVPSTGAMIDEYDRVFYDTAMFLDNL
jgi:hypothetical protein